MIKGSSNILKLQTMAKQWAKNKDIMILADCNEKDAKRIREDIEKQIVAEGKKCPKGYTVPMARVILYLELDEDRMIRMASLESSILKHEKSHLHKQMTNN